MNDGQMADGGLANNKLPTPSDYSNRVGRDSGCGSSGRDGGEGRIRGLALSSAPSCSGLGLGLGFRGALHLGAGGGASWTAA